MTWAAPAWSRQSVKPPVDAPTSRQRRPAGAIPSASSALRSLIPPRDTYGRGASTPSSTSGSTSCPGLAARASPGPRRPWPAMTAAAARVREGKSPRSASKESRRTRGTAGTLPAVRGLTGSRARPGHPHGVTRTISLPIHAAIELALGFALLAGPFALGADPAGLVVAVAFG